MPHVETIGSSHPEEYRAKFALRSNKILFTCLYNGPLWEHNLSLFGKITFAELFLSNNFFLNFQMDLSTH